MSCENAIQDIVALGSMGYQNATNGMVAVIGDLSRSVTVWKEPIAVAADGPNQFTREWALIELYNDRMVSQLVWNRFQLGEYSMSYIDFVQ